MELKFRVWQVGGPHDDIKEDLLARCETEEEERMLCDDGVAAGIRVAVFDDRDNKIYPLL